MTHRHTVSGRVPAIDPERYYETEASLQEITVARLSRALPASELRGFHLIADRDDYDRLVREYTEY